jgi:hypothetical protein
LRPADTVSKGAGYERRKTDDRRAPLQTQQTLRNPW